MGGGGSVGRGQEPLADDPSTHAIQKRWRPPEPMIMIDPIALGLLRETMDLLNDAPHFSLRRDRSHTSYALASRIEGFLTSDYRAAAPREVVATIRERWHARSCIRIDPDPVMRADTDGLWVSAWLRAGAEPVESDPRTASRYRAVLDNLPVVTREVFLLHRRDAMVYPAIAERLAIDVAEVERHIADALEKLAMIGGEG